MGRINKPNKANPVSADEFIIYDSEDTTDDKNITLGQIASFTEAQDSTLTGTKVFADGVKFEKGNIALGEYTPLPTTIGTYVASYVSPTYGARVLSYDGSAYQDLGLGSMPTAGTVSMKSLANGDCNFGYNVNIVEDLGVTGDVTATSFIGSGSQLTDIGPKLGTCSTAAATSVKEVTIPNFTLETGKSFYIVFTYGNSSTAAWLKINGGSNEIVYTEVGTQVSAGTNCYAYFPANVPIEFYYDGSKIKFKNRIIATYTSGVSWWRFWADGWIEQSSSLTLNATSNTSVPFLISFKNTNYRVNFQITGTGATTASRSVVERVDARNVANTGAYAADGSNYLAATVTWEARGY